MSLFMVNAFPVAEFLIQFVAKATLFCQNGRSSRIYILWIVYEYCTADCFLCIHRKDVHINRWLFLMALVLSSNFWACSSQHRWIERQQLIIRSKGRYNIFGTRSGTGSSILWGLIVIVLRRWRTRRIGNIGVQRRSSRRITAGVRVVPAIVVPSFRIMWVLRIAHMRGCAIVRWRRRVAVVRVRWRALTMRRSAIMLLVPNKWLHVMRPMMVAWTIVSIRRCTTCHEICCLMRRKRRPSTQQRKLPVNLVEIGLPLHMWDHLPTIGLDPLHQPHQRRQASEETLVVVRAAVVAGLMQALEAPAIELAAEWFVLGLDKVFGDHGFEEDGPVMDSPCSAVGHPWYDLHR